MAIVLMPITYKRRDGVRPFLEAHLNELSVYGAVDKAYPYFDAYWQEAEQRWPYFIQCDEVCIGFAFVRRDPSGVWSIAEFYIAPAYHGRGAGFTAGVELIATRRGAWTLTVLANNAAAQKFWPKVLAASGAQGVRSQWRQDMVAYHFRIA